MSHASSSYVWWLMSRSAGMVALLLVTCSVLLGLAMAARAIPPRRKREAVRLHEHLALMGLVAIAAHGLLLLADPWLHPGLKGITLPFSMAYRPAWTGVGILGGYLAAALGLSFYMRKQIGARLWRRLHRFTVVVYVLGLAHTLGAGTDATIPAVRIALLSSMAPVLFLMTLRVLRTRERPNINPVDKQSSAPTLAGPRARPGDRMRPARVAQGRPADSATTA